MWEDGEGRQYLVTDLNGSDDAPEYRVITECVFTPNGVPPASKVSSFTESGEFLINSKGVIKLRNLNQLVSRVEASQRVNTRDLATKPEIRMGDVWRSRAGGSYVVLSVNSGRNKKPVIAFDPEREVTLFCTLDGNCESIVIHEDSDVGCDSPSPHDLKTLVRRQEIETASHFWLEGKYCRTGVLYENRLGFFTTVEGVFTVPELDREVILLHNLKTGTVYARIAGWRVENALYRKVDLEVGEVVKTNVGNRYTVDSKSCRGYMTSALGISGWKAYATNGKRISEQKSTEAEEWLTSRSPTMPSIEQQVSKLWNETFVPETVEQKVSEISGETPSPCVLGTVEVRDAEPPSDCSLKVGDHVAKLKGYGFPSVVVSVFKTTAGKTRLVCESTIPGSEGMLHIFNPEQLALDVNKSKPDWFTSKP